MQYQENANTSLPYCWDTFQSFGNTATSSGNEVETCMTIITTNTDPTKLVHIDWLLHMYPKKNTFVFSITQFNDREELERIQNIASRLHFSRYSGLHYIPASASSRFTAGMPGNCLPSSRHQYFAAYTSMHNGTSLGFDRKTSEVQRGKCTTVSRARHYRNIIITSLQQHCTSTPSTERETLTSSRPGAVHTTSRYRRHSTRCGSRPCQPRGDNVGTRILIQFQQ